MLGSSHLFVDGTIGTTFEDAAGTRPAAAGADLFGRFVSVYQSNEILFAELESIKQNLARANTYLETPGSNPALAHAQIGRLKTRRSAALTMLRANRLQARALIARSVTPVEADVA